MKCIVSLQKVTLYGSVFVDDRDPVTGREIEIEGLSQPAVITQNGLVMYGSDGKKIRVTQLQLEDGRMIPANKWGKEEKVEKLELSPEEKALQEKLRVSQCCLFILTSVSFLLSSFPFFLSPFPSPHCFRAYGLVYSAFPLWRIRQISLNQEHHQWMSQGMEIIRILHEFF